MSFAIKLECGYLFIKIRSTKTALTQDDFIKNDLISYTSEKKLT
jgi:hypothetical protein